MSLNIFISRSISKSLHNEITNLVNEHFEKSSKRLPLKDADVVILQGHGDPKVMGNSFYDNTVQIILDQEINSEELEVQLPRTLYHELHHQARISAVGFGDSLEEVLITEGLAVCFEDEMGFKDNKLDASDDEINLLRAKFEKERASKEFDYYHWFRGTNDLPEWAGYKLAYWVVSKSLMLSKKKSSDCYSVLPSEINFISPQ